jgi:tight adherence protein B
MPNPIAIVYVLAVLAIFTFLQAVGLLVEREVREARGLRRKTLADGLSPWLKEVLVIRRIEDFEALITGSGVRHPPAAILTAMALTVLGGTLLFTFVGYGGAQSFFAGITIGTGFPLLALMQMRKRRLAKLALQLPDALDMLVRSLRAGLPVPMGIQMIAKEMPAPVSDEFRRVCDALSYGLDLREALEQLAQRVHIPEVTYMVAAIRVQYTTGGNLAEVLCSLGGVMRERVRFKMKVKALSAESRLSANIMAFVPFLLIAGMMYIRPDFYNDVPTSSLLQAVLGGAAILLVIGVIVMRRVVKIRA